MGCRPGRCHLRRWAADTSDLHGLKHIAGSGNTFRRLIWLCLFLTALGFCIFECYLVIKGYISFNHVTQVDVYYTTEVEFPAITVCNINKYRESALTEEDIKNVGVHLGIVDEDYNLLLPDLYTDEFKDFINSVNWTTVEEDPDYNMTEFTIRTGHQQEDMIVSCLWKEEPCEETDLQHSLTHLGNCYSFNIQGENSNEVDWKHSYSAGSANGLQLILNAEIPEYTPSNDLDSGAMDAGLRIMFHYPTEPPYPKELGFSVSAGDHSFISMRHEKITSLPWPYTECETDGGDIITHFGHYSLQACRIECETLVVEAECGCRLPEMPGDADVCSPADVHECAHPTLVDFISGNLNSSDTCECFSPCLVENYPFTLSTSKLRPLFLEALYANTSTNFTSDYISENIAVVSIYYEALNFQTIDMLPEYTFATLLAVLGGNLGLFLGASFLTIAQLGEYFLDEMIGWCICTKSKESEEERNGGNKVEPSPTVKTTDAWGA
ncbi:acid-sensing ion channel 1A-like [Lytechinus variegatus]|uniref:acid-sensing ion channel 1A-like n=1 Tax=Lytechinus variegatus TaxID=7654 RepID=UPI001BB12B26|nr:acid-sensing ion channel 1A-like [Lytechinus variegatus]